MGQAKKRNSKKAGRNGRSPAHQRYNAEKRWAKHKAVHIMREVRHRNGKIPTGLPEDVEIALAKFGHEPRTQKAKERE